MKRRKNHNRERVLTTVVTCSLIAIMAFGVLSVVRSTRKSSENIVDLTQTQPQNVVSNDNKQTQQNNSPTRAYADILNEKATQKGDNQIALATEPAQEDETQEEPKEPAAPVEAETSQSDKKEVAANSNEGILAKYSFGEGDTLMRPVQGDVVMKFSMDSTVYYKTLGLYKVNPAVNIAAEPGTNVIAAASGVVQSVVQNEETGTTVTVAIGDGYTTTYGMLGDVNLKEGMTVIAGNVIGAVSEPTRYYEKEGPNLYFKLAKDEVPLDPTAYFAE